MKVALFTKNKTDEHEAARAMLVDALRKRDIDIVDNWTPSVSIDVMVSIGGDGTLLSAVHRIGRSGIPVVGINFGHLGFLTTAGRDDIDKLADCLRNGDYTIERRTMLEVTLDGVASKGESAADDAMPNLKLVNDKVYALNEVYLHRLDQRPLLHTQVQVDGSMVATYAADGLIVATPTGSTAYSLSCGGPILAPGSGSLVITPIAAHTLTQRPIILSDNVVLRMRDEEPMVRYTLGVDSFVCTVSGSSVIEVKKADYCTRLLRIGHQNFFSAIRDKLMWGL
ncbi:MAG: NAD(+)/NADH kinase [Bacteroidales bacterium]|nr:NAD(+)/NADH kinase [Bacteroidales bacterium]